MRTDFRYEELKSLSAIIGVSPHDLLEVLKAPGGTRQFYKVRRKPKPDGTHRIIGVPQGILRDIQDEIKTRIIDRLPVSDAACSYIRGRSWLTAAIPHLQSHSMLHLDMSGAYNQTSLHQQKYQWEIDKEKWREGHFRDFDLVRGDNPIDGASHIMDLIAEFTDWQLLSPVGFNVRYVLPQGSPTSPGLFNYCCHELDRKLTRLAPSLLRYSRYGDNLFVSCLDTSIPPILIRSIYRIIGRCRFSVNPRKTLYIRDGNTPSNPLRIFCVNVIGGDVSLRPGHVDRLRAMLYFAGTNGNFQTYAGVRGLALQIYGMMPSRLSEAFARGLKHHGDSLESDP